MRKTLGDLTPLERRILAGAVAFASVVGGFAVAGNNSDTPDTLDRPSSISTMDSTSTTTVKKTQFDVRVGDSKSSESSSVSRTVIQSVSTED